MSKGKIAQILTPRQATDTIRKKAQDDRFGIHMTEHARDRLSDRDLIMDDVLHVLKYGSVYKDGEDATRPGFFKYEMECETPNSANRSIKVVAIPDPKSAEVKVVSVMWADSPTMSS